MDARELSARLPPPRDDEPPSLRQDILDELADHLHCALRRELLATGNEEAARQNVIEEFGDPGEVARKLWLQAMWSKIMSQRLMLGAMGLVTAVCLTLAGLTAWFMQQQRAAALQQQQTIVDMMDRLVRQAESKGQSEGASEVPAPTVSSIQVKLTHDTPDGPPAKDHAVMLRQLGFDKEKSTSEASDSNGSADFGYCDPGRYAITVWNPWRFNNTENRFVLHPSTAHVEYVVCPPAGDEVQVSVIAALPEDLQRLSVQAFVQLDAGSLVHEGKVWRENAGPRGILARHDGWKAIPEFSLSQSVTPGEHRIIVLIIPGRRGDVSDYRIMAGARYGVRGLRLIIPYTDRRSGDFRGQPATRSGQSYEVIASNPLFEESQARGLNRPNPPLEREFVAEAGKLNEWVIPIPEELNEQARQYLKDHPAPSENNE